jgi:hypothetical protein
MGETNAMVRRAVWSVRVLAATACRRSAGDGSLGEVPADGRSYFCVPEPAGGASYRLTVIGASMSTTGQ